jgi:hypothetical protein
MKIPTFDELPIRKDLPAESSWGVFGDRIAAYRGGDQVNGFEGKRWSTTLF